MAYTSKFLLTVRDPTGELTVMCFTNDVAIIFDKTTRELAELQEQKPEEFSDLVKSVINKKFYMKLQIKKSTHTKDKFKFIIKLYL